MNSINKEILHLAKSITEKLKHPSDSEADFEIKSPRKNKPKVEHVIKITDLPLSSVSKYKSKSNISLVTFDKRLEKMNSGKEESSKSDKPEKDFNKSLPSQYSAMKQTEINSTNFMSEEDIEEDDELWLIMAPKDCKLKKQSVEMEGRHELKGGKFEIEFFRSDSENNMVTLVCDNEKLVSGPHFKGCVQISEKLQTFSPKYHDVVKKENPIPSGLKQRYVPFGADVDGDGARYKKDEDFSVSSEGLENNTTSLNLDTDSKSNVIDSPDADGRPISERKDKKERKLKRKHTDIPSSDVNSLTGSQDTEISINSEISKKKKKKKRKSQHEDINE